jgi:hypothetical protein
MKSLFELINDLKDNEITLEIIEVFNENIKVSLKKEINYKVLNSSIVIIKESYNEISLRQALTSGIKSINNLQIKKRIVDRSKSNCNS